MMQPLRTLNQRISAVYSRIPVAVQVRSITYGENDLVNPNFVNRNPRNMEMLRVARKREGWELEASSPKYWYKLMLERSNKHTRGWVEHHTGSIVVSASTREWAIKKNLYSTSDTSAVYNIGCILARRCLESGITEMYTELDQFTETSGKIQKFMSAMKEGGVELKEPDFIDEYSFTCIGRTSPNRPVLPWHVKEEEVVSSPASPVLNS